VDPGVTLACGNLGSGRPIVLLPWFSLDASVMAAAFEPVFGKIDAFARHYLDLPGVGDSPPVEPSTDAVVEAVIEDIAARTRPVILVGCSYGGYVAAAVTRRRPDLVAALALVCSGVRIGLADRTLPDIPRTRHLAWPDEVLPDTRSHLDVALATDDIAVAGTVAHHVDAAKRDDAYLEDLRARGYAVADEGDDTAYDGPMLMLAGRQDRIGGYVDQFDAMRRYPCGTYAVIDGAGHYLPFEKPAAFAAILTAWLAALPPRQGS
jgi:pimeloyl-ACP methyl ester carboxylesterase